MLRALGEGRAALLAVVVVAGAAGVVAGTRLGSLV
jgi:hypothetical protein